MSPYGGPEDQLFSMRPLSGTAVHLRGGEVGELTAHASPSGEFAFEDLVPGHYRIFVDLPQRMKPWEETEITVPAKGCSEVNIRTAFNGRLAGRVTDKSGAPVSYIAVEVVRASEAGHAERSFRWQTADKSGAFELGPLPPDVYIVGVNIVKHSGSREKPRTYYPGTPALVNAKRIRVEEGQLVKDLDFQLEANAQSASSH